MGKVLETKFSDVSHRILRKPVKRDKFSASQSSTSKNDDTNPKKRKISGINDDDSHLPNKLQRLSTDILPESLDIVQTEIQDEMKGNEIVVNKIYGEKCSTSDYVYLKIEDNSCDLFLDDELKNIHGNFIFKDLYFHIMDEICLEGLDGITIEAFWTRLLVVLEGVSSISGFMKENIWKIIMSKHEDLHFYELPDPRRELEIYDRLNFYNWDIGVVMELAFELPDIYPHSVVNVPNIQGSCANFNDRMDVSATVLGMHLKDIEKTYGNKLAIVAQQQLRTLALAGEFPDPQIEMANIQYCILERIGRSRKLGEITQGNMSLTSALKMDSKSVFHYRRQLYLNGHISKQFFYVKSALTDQNKSGKLLHLRRFFNFSKTRYMMVADKAINIMKKQPGCMMEVGKLKRMIESTGSLVGKLFKTAEFRKYVKTDSFYPYRFVYPNAKKSEYLRKSTRTEKMLRCYELKNPHINIIATWSHDNDDSDEDEEEEEDKMIGSTFNNMEFLKELYYHIYSKGAAGCSLFELNKMVGVDRNSCRMALKKLTSKGVIGAEKVDIGRQRSMVYKAKSLQKSEQVDSQPIESSSHSTSSITAKMIERQRAAILKNKQIKAEVGDEKQISSLNQLETRLPKMTPRLIKVQAPQIMTCPFLIPNFTRQLDLKHEATQLNLTFPRDYINLTYKLFSTIGRFDINKILKEIIPSNLKPATFTNFEDFYSSKMEYDPITKIILLKAMFREITVKGTTALKSSARNLPCRIAIPKSKRSMTSSEVMGDHPVRVFHKQENDVTTEIVESTAPSRAQASEGGPPQMDFISDRVASRTRLVIDEVHKRRVFEEPHKLLRIIQEEEKNEGYEKKMDKKSLNRILRRLVEEGYIKIYRINIFDSNIAKSLSFICHPSISHTEDQIQSACQQMKWKYFIGSVKKTVKLNVPVVIKKVEEKMKDSPFSESDVMNSIEEMKRLEKLKVVELRNRYAKNASVTHGVKPKFIRMRIVHEFLFYLVYEQRQEGVGEEPVPKREVEKLFKGYGIEITQEELENLPAVYCKEISWKMFIPPLPHHKSWSEGWALMCDVILRLPVSVLCKVHSCSFHLPELTETLRHPIKRFYLVKDLSESIRSVTLFKRRYLFSIHDSITRLAYCGLVQYGPKKYKEKDQFFIYLNRKASLFDTTSSRPSYNLIEDKMYPRMSFNFRSQTDLENYWYNLYGICMNTKLNARKEGQVVVLTEISAKPELERAMKSRTCEEAIANDNGDIPGDKKGAACLDSALWSHMKRNWFWASKVPSIDSASMGLKKERMNKVLPKEVPFKNLVNKPSKIFLHKPPKDVPPPKKPKKMKPKPLKPSKTFNRLTRKIPERKATVRRQYYDSIDKMILKKIGTNRRVRWTAEEDKTLVLCKIADLFLQNDKYKKQIVPYCVVRDVLHRVCPVSKGKTSRAVQRRLKTLHKESSISFSELYQNLLQVRPIFEYYSILVDKIWKGNDGQESMRFNETQITNVFVILMSYVLRHQDEVFAVLQGNVIDIDHLSENNLKYTEQVMVPQEKSSLKFKDATSEDEIKVDVLKSVIHSSVVCGNNATKALQLLRVYQRYPDHLIRKAVDELRKSNTITYNKFSSKRDKLWQGPYHLSQLYIFYQFTTYNITTGVESYRTFLALRPNSESRSSLDFSEEGVSRKRYGQLLGMNEFFTFWNNVSFHFDLPQNMIILNPDMANRDELVAELARRYQAKMRKTQQHQEGVESEEGEADVGADRNTSSSIVRPPDADDAQTDALDDAPSDLETIERLRTWVSDCIAVERGRRSPSPDFTKDRPSEEERERKLANLEVEEDRPARRTAKERELTLEGIREGERVSDSIAKERDRRSPSPDFAKSDSLRKRGRERELENLEVGENQTARKAEKERVLTVEEIREEMLKAPVPNEDRLVPYITELSDLLSNKELSADLASDEKTLKRLRKHFVAQYVQLAKVDMEDLDLLVEHHMVHYLENAISAKKMWEKIQSDPLVDMVVPLTEVTDLLKEQGGQKEDVDLMMAIVDFVAEKGFLGATGQQLKDRFSVAEKTRLPLSDIVKVLVDCGVLLQAGIGSIRFVHHRYRLVWLVETYEVTEDEPTLSLDTTISEKPETIGNQLEQKQIMRLQISPWYKINGKLNKECFKTWICCILSYCLDSPGITLLRLCEKFFYLKPVDVYYLLVILQELGSLEIMCFDHKKEYLSSKWEPSTQRRATFLDNFNDMSISPSNVSMTCLGSFLYHDQVSEVPFI